MAIKLTCDYTGEPLTQEEAHVFGEVKQVHYGEAGRDAYRAFTKQRDALHTRLAREYAAGLQELVDAFFANAPEGAELPDIDRPDADG